jgi:hypothetical protein
VNLSARNWDCAFVEKVKLVESFVDLLLWHIILRQPKPSMLMYHVASCSLKSILFKNNPGNTIVERLFWGRLD